MNQIISQTATLSRPEPALPDWRNLGVVLRTVVLVNLMVVAAALVREESWQPLRLAALGIVAFVEPHLLVQLVVLYALSPWLASLPYRRGVAVVLALTLIVGVLLGELHGRVADGAPGPLRYAVLALGAASILLGYFHLRSRALSPALAEARLQALQARIRPHFLFNSLNAVLSLVRRDPARAEAALEDVSDLFRVLMRENRDLRPLGEEVELCRQYLNLEKLRLEDRLRVEWHVENMPEDALVPPLVLQPLLENAVYHGIEPLAGPGTISINIFLRRGEVHAILRNPYHGRSSHQNGNRMAVQNIRERLALHFDAEAGLDVKSTADCWRVHIRMPYRSARGDVRSRALAPANG
jgi:two-component system sensor histidine kinase AlgZ